MQSLVCLIILAIMLVAGLSPFRRPKNAVTWLENQNGLRFGRMGLLATEQSFDLHQGCSIEMWLKLEVLRESGTLLVFSKPATPMQLWVRQYHHSLLVERWAGDAERQVGIIGIDDVFSVGKPVFLTIASGADSTSMYLDGHLVRTFSGFRPLDNCSGQLVVGSSTVSPDTMSGELYGLAVYQAELNTPRIAEHFASWTKLGHPELTETDAAAAVYLFNEHAGNIAHNSVRPALDLSIPNRFFLLHHGFLQAFWKENRTSRGYWKDILINIVGFMPLGFCFCSLFSSVGPNRHPILVTVLLGFALSLTIEVLQAYLPTRTSGTTDLITNTTGTFLGATLYASGLAKAALAKLQRVSRQPIS